MNAITKHEGGEVVVADQTAALVQVIARAASDPTVDVEKMERLLAMQERVLARNAEADFNAAMNAAQREMRSVAADAENQQTRSRYATYAALDRALRPIYTKHGFSISFDTGGDAPEGFVLVLAYVSHRGGHTRTYRAKMPADGKGAKGGDVMTKTHAFGAGTSYGMRYLLKMIFNVAVGEDDNDGNGAGAPKSLAEQLAESDEGQALLQTLRDAALNGSEALSEAFNKTAKSKVRTAVWTLHGPSLKAAAAKVSE